MFELNPGQLSMAETNTNYGSNAQEKKLMLRKNTCTIKDKKSRAYLYDVREFSLIFLKNNLNSRDQNVGILIS